MLKERPSPSILQGAIIAAVIFFVIVFAIITMNTGDILWFWPIFDGESQRIVIHCYGKDVVVQPNDPSYDLVNSAVNDSLSGSKRWDSLSMSDATYDDYQISSVMMVLELGYNPPTRIHSFYKFFKNIDTIVIPLDGRHASTNTVFGRLRGNTLAGSMHVENIQNMITTLGEQELCPIP